MLQEFKQQVYEAHMALWENRLAVLTWGNVSGLFRDTVPLMVIKPGGVPYQQLKPEDMVVLNLKGEKVEGTLKPSSDTPTHLALYNAFPKIGGICHTHSPWATAWAQTGEDIPPYGTTHADYFYGPIPCTADLTQAQIEEAYEHHTATVMIEAFQKRKTNPLDVPAVLVKDHGPFTFGADAKAAVMHAVVLEEVAKIAGYMHRKVAPLSKALLDKHYFRKHGPHAYYGQTVSAQKL